MKRLIPLVFLPSALAGCCGPCSCPAPAPEYCVPSPAVTIEDGWATLPPGVIIEHPDGTRETLTTTRRMKVSPQLVETLR